MYKKATVIALIVKTPYVCLSQETGNMGGGAEWPYLFNITLNMGRRCRVTVSIQHHMEGWARAAKKEKNKVIA